MNVKISTRRFMVVLLGSGILFFMPLFANAHVKWFTDVQPEKVNIESILSPLFITLTLVVSLLLAALTQLLPMLSGSKFIQRVDARLDQVRTYSIRILTYGLAAALCIQVITGSLFVPDFEINSVIEIVLIWSAIILLLVPHHYATKLAALIIFSLLISVTVDAGVFHMLDYGFYFAIVGTLLVQKTKLSAWGYPLLYLGTGLSLCWVALEKFVFPTMAIDIIQKHGVPVFGFSPEVFVVLAAFIEFVVGYLLVVGILNRLLSFVLTLIFISTTMLFGWTEVVGHFLIHIILITFIMEGVSFYKPPVQMHRTLVDRMVFVSLNFIFVLFTFMLIYYRYA